MNLWLIASGLLAAACAAGDAFAGRSMFYRPIASRLSDALLASIFSGMWYLITLHFALSAGALFAAGILGRPEFAGWLVAAQFLGYAAIYFVLSLRLGGPERAC
jgi:hypothetical protein